MDPQTGATIGSTLAAVILGAWGFIQQQKAKSADKVSREDVNKSNLDLAESYRQRADDWKERYEVEHKESQDYRKYVHDKAREDQANVLRLTEENAKLNARTDLTPLIEHMKRQSDTNDAVAKSLVQLSEAVGLLMARLNRDHPDPEPEKTEP